MLISRTTVYDGTEDAQNMGSERDVHMNKCQSSDKTSYQSKSPVWKQPIIKPSMKINLYMGGSRFSPVLCSLSRFHRILFTTRAYMCYRWVPVLLEKIKDKYIYHYQNLHVKSNLFFFFFVLRVFLLTPAFFSFLVLGFWEKNVFFSLLFTGIE